ncbi:early protein E6 [Papio hamadryas papillomavirus 1]|uniref:Protein E6 n=1 Tax=Papio hamadryas papillomavirus 1 TaxID=990303 RepID=H9LBT7_RHPV1|nr:E6 gene product [Papio hamadryas papillomavirus 1]AEA35047.1 early protein E6 [Papio hamadryas papillomavirus 1]
MVEGYQERARTLHELCEQRGETQHTIELECVYCLAPLTRIEVYDFARWDLRVVYRRGNAYGVCRLCLRFYSKVRKYRRYNYSIYGSTLERSLKKQLGDIVIRCYCCQKPLGPVEKQRHVDRGQRFHNIADVWTGRCLECWRPSEAELNPDIDEDAGTEV